MQSKPPPGNESHKIEYRPTAGLIPYARNARTHSEAQVAQVAASIQEFGWTNPVLLDGKNGIIAGHARVLAARKLGIKKVPTIELSHLSDTQKRAYILADNRLALSAGWDDEMLGVELQELQLEEYPLEVIGFTEEEIFFHAGNGKFDPAPGENEKGLDQLDDKLIECPECGHEFKA